MYNELSMLKFDYACLEAAIESFNVTNGITEEDLIDPRDYSDYTSMESVDCSGFCNGLFDTDFALEASDAKPNKVGLGTKIKEAFKNVINAIKKAFASLRDGIKSFFEKFKKKTSSAAAASTPGVKEVLESGSFRQIRTKIQKFFNFLNQAFATNAKRVATIVTDINKAIDDGAKNTYDAGRRASADDVSNIGKRYAANTEVEKIMSNTNIEKTGADVRASTILAGAEAQVAKDRSMIDAIEKNINELFDLIGDIKKDYEKLSDEFAKSRSNRRADYESITKNDNETTEEFNKRKIAAGRGSRGAEGPGVLKHAYYCVLNEDAMNSVSKYISTVVSECAKNEKYCEGIAGNSALANSSDAGVKLGYQLAQIYMKASKAFTKLSTMIAKIDEVPQLANSRTSDSATARDESEKYS